MTNFQGNSKASAIARMLGERIEPLVRELLPGGHREKHSWRCGSIAGEPGYSLAVELGGRKRGVWLDHANDSDRGDALDLVKACLGGSMAEAILWSERWLGLAPGELPIPQRTTVRTSPDSSPPTWPKIWRRAQPIAGTLAERYLTTRGLAFADPHGAVLRFDPRRCRLAPGSDDKFEHHPALLAIVRNVHRGAPCGLHNIFLRPDGSDRLRDKKGKTTTGRIAGGAVMLSPFDDVTGGLTVAEGIETAISLLMDDLAPAWALCGASNLAKFPILAGIEAITVAADTGAAGQVAAREVAARWHKAGRETRIVPPAADDWAASRKIAS